MPKCKKTSKISNAAKDDDRPCKINRKQPSKSEFTISNGCHFTSLITFSCNKYIHSWVVGLASFTIKQLEDKKNEKRFGL